MNTMQIAAVCCTYLRPKLLGRLLRCFELQDYPHRQLLILDDAGQYENQHGDRWRLVSTRKRFASLGEKRNAAAALLGDHVDALAVWDDDDLYLPWALSASAAALRVAPWSRPSVVLVAQPGGSLRQHATGGLFHGGWAYRREAFWAVGAYPAVNNGEDQALAERLAVAGTPQADPIALGFRPFYVDSWGGAGWHLSGMGPAGYRRLAGLRGGRTRLVSVEPELNLHAPTIRPGVHPRPF